jgi:hypothetical protein
MKLALVVFEFVVLFIAGFAITTTITITIITTTIITITIVVVIIAVIIAVITAVLERSSVPMVLPKLQTPSPRKSPIFFTQAPESTEESDSVGPKSPMDSRVRIQKKWTLCASGS